MIEFPVSTRVHRRLPKEAFYKHLTLTAVLKEKFVTDVERIDIENSLSNESLNLNSASEIKEILVLCTSCCLFFHAVKNKVLHFITINCIIQVGRMKMRFL